MKPFDIVQALVAKGGSVNRLCRLQGVSTSGYYARRKRMESVGPAPDKRIVILLRELHQINHNVYGSRRMQQALQRRSVCITRGRIRRLMRENGIISVQERRFKNTTNSRHSLGYSKNILEQKFVTVAPDRAWVGDITYIWTTEGWCYLATVIDLFSRRIVGWSMDKNMKSQLIERALQRALEMRRPKAGLIFHSDRGSQYASRNFRKLLRSQRLEQSMSDAGNCYDNAVAESFFASLKKECVMRKQFTTRTEAFDAIASYIRDFYNPVRLHSHLDYQSPIEFELSAMEAKAA